MFRVINFTSLIRHVAIATTFISLYGYELVRYTWFKNLSTMSIASIAPWVVLTIILILTTDGLSRFIWNVASKVNPSMYPDLNGTWEGEIETEDGLKIVARALIRQTLLQTQIDLHTETAKSCTLETTPAIESGQCKLYYSYRSKPKNPNWGAYTGCTIFDVRRPARDLSQPLEISGYYFTDRKTNGRISLRQVKNKNVDDVSFY